MPVTTTSSIAASTILLFGLSSADTAKALNAIRLEVTIIDKQIFEMSCFIIFLQILTGLTSAQNNKALKQNYPSPPKEMSNFVDPTFNSQK
jgi:hypothetical protein